MSYPLITLCGSHNVKFDWVKPCIKSWHLLENVDPNNWFLVPDHHLDPMDQKKFESLGFTVFNSAESEMKIEACLEGFPALKEIRTKDLTWRKILDTSILLSHFEKVLLIDTDVLVNHLCVLPEFDFDICYMREDIPAYRANWRLPWSEPMVPALNTGFVIFKPSQVDFEFLESLTKKYLLKCKDYWWTEQSAWACLAARLPKRFIFNGQQARVLSGFKKRSLSDVLKNKYNYYGYRGTIDNFDDFKVFIEGSTIIHYAGLGKTWFNESFEYLDNLPSSPIPCQIIVSHESTLSFMDKLFISSRLFMKELI